LARDEVLFAAGDPSNATLNAIERLQQRSLLIVAPRGDLRVRHRVIAEVLLEKMASEGALERPLTRLAVAVASKAGPTIRRTAPEYRRVKTIMNHDWLRRVSGVAATMRIYAELEPFMHWDHHFWLQRGSLELQEGDLWLAENFLNQAYALGSDDALVQTEYGFLKTKIAVVTANGVEARELFETGLSFLDGAIRLRGGSDPHQYHIYGKQVLAWILRGDVTKDERRELLKNAAELVSQGRRLHPRDDWLRELFVELENELLASA
jgi:hypothetical protein